MHIKLTANSNQPTLDSGDISNFLKFCCIVNCVETAKRDGLASWQASSDELHYYSKRSDFLNKLLSPFLRTLTRNSTLLLSFVFSSCRR